MDPKSKDLSVDEDGYIYTGDTKTDYRISEEGQQALEDKGLERIPPHEEKGKNG